MQVDFFTICDNAQVYAGKAILVGALNQLNAKKVPFSVTLSLAVRLSYEIEEYATKKYEFTFLDPDRIEFMPKFVCESNPVSAKVNGSIITTDVNIGFNNITFKKFGVHRVVLKTDEKEYSFRFAVQKAI